MERPQLLQRGIPEGTAAFGNAAEPRQRRSWETTGIFGEAFPAVPAEVTPGQRLRAPSAELGDAPALSASPLLFLLSCSSSLMPQIFFFPLI